MDLRLLSEDPSSKGSAPGLGFVVHCGIEEVTWEHKERMRQCFLSLFAMIVV